MCAPPAAVESDSTTQLPTFAVVSVAYNTMSVVCAFTRTHDRKMNREMSAARVTPENTLLLSRAGFREIKLFTAKFLCLTIDYGRATFKLSTARVPEATRSGVAVPMRTSILTLVSCTPLVPFQFVHASWY